MAWTLLTADASSCAQCTDRLMDEVVVTMCYIAYYLTNATTSTN